jgi:hypothetical protein
MGRPCDTQYAHSGTVRAWGEYYRGEGKDSVNEKMERHRAHRAELAVHMVKHGIDQHIDLPFAFNDDSDERRGIHHISRRLHNECLR